MALNEISVPDAITQIARKPAADDLIDLANERIEVFMLREETVSENFVPCDFHLLDQALTWIQQEHLLAGNRFCELGSGFGVGALLAAQHGMEAIGIEVEANLAEQACQLADTISLPAEFYTGSFVPREISDILDLGSDIEHVETFEGDIYEEIGLEMDEFDLFFAFPWPGEHQFFEAVFQAAAADNALLLTYRGRDGMHLLRKV